MWHAEGEVTALPIETLRYKTSRELIAFVMSSPEELVARRTSDRYATFGKLVKEQPSKVVCVLLQLALSGECPSRFICPVVDGFSGEERGRFRRSHWRYAGIALAALQDDCLVQCAIDEARWLHSATPDHVEAIGGKAWRVLWERLWSISQQVPRTVESDEIDRWVGLAINHPAGVLAEALLSRLWSLELRIGSGIPSEFADCVDNILSGDTLAHQLAQVIQVRSFQKRLPQPKNS